MYFSIIVPVYNVEKYLRECIDSILCQTFTDFELILVDDGSKDESGKICDQYAEKDNRIKVIHKENGGQSTARNCGVEESSGKYIVFLDSDDFISEDTFLQEIKDKSADNDVVVYGYRKYYDDNRVKEVPQPTVTTTEKNEFSRQLVVGDAFYCSCWSKSIKASLLKDNNIIFDESLRCEDMDWYYSVVLVAEKFSFIDKPFVNYRQRENSVTSAFNRKSITDFIITIDKWYSKFNNIDDEHFRTTMLSSLAKLYCNLIISYSRNAKMLKAEKKQIFSFKPLLKYNLNPRTRMIGKCSKIFGLNITCKLLRIIDKIR